MEFPTVQHHVGLHRMRTALNNMLGSNPTRNDLPLYYGVTDRPTKRLRVWRPKLYLGKMAKRRREEEEGGGQDESPNVAGPKILCWISTYPDRMEVVHYVSEIIQLWQT